MRVRCIVAVLSLILVPAVAQHNTSPLGSVVVTIVLLNVALIWAIARVTLRRTFRRLAFATVYPSLAWPRSTPHWRQVGLYLFVSLA